MTYADLVFRFTTTFYVVLVVAELAMWLGTKSGEKPEESAPASDPSVCPRCGQRFVAGLEDLAVRPGGTLWLSYHCHACCVHVDGYARVLR